MGQIDQIINLIEDMGELTIDEISEEIGVSEDAIENTLRQAEIDGLVFRKVTENKDVYKL